MPALIVVSLLLQLLGAPAFDGLATWYGIDDGSSERFATGEAFRLDAPYCALDVSEWEAWQGRTLLVLSVADGRYAELVVSDAGRLYRPAPRRMSMWTPYIWLAADDPSGIGPARGFVLDIPHDTYVEVFGDERTRHVLAWWAGEAME